ncbi:hypothetical protein EDF58_101585 [Novosphingobium sp. PhB57]|uniref:hypothetical protein n=1 Tax=Novosphingobium sp. PhB57 TaxID=2485107 RepID=UPI001048CAEC|nr:hypothetical protein [Novosphingobium sp. PhB57]TCU61271.1 hypothetical protein EDF58_101585 [Novosphingobium sp. PhB57]
MSEQDAFSTEDYAKAAPMTLRCDANSVEAIGFIEGLLDTLSFPDPKKLLKPSTVERRRRALRALMADLMQLAPQGLAGYHGMAPKNFPAKLLGFGYDVFLPVKDALVAAGLLDFAPGRQRLHSFDNRDTGKQGSVVQQGGYQARFRLTKLALEQAQGAGVDLKAWADHWNLPETLQETGTLLQPASPLVELRGRAGRVKGRKVQGLSMDVDMASPAIQPIIEDLQAHNGFLEVAGVAGVDFVGLRRIFNDGGEPDFAWNKGGRFYSRRAEGMGKAYEVLSGDQRRKRVKFGGEAVGEVDMSASQLRILYAVLAEELPAELSDDLYALPGASRDAVKLVIAQALGKDGAHAKRWGSEASKAYAKAAGKRLQEDHPFKVVHHVALKCHPILERLGGDGCPTALGLQFIESEIIREAMALLRREGIPSLPVHDSLIVPVSKLDDAEEALRDAFMSVVNSLIGKPTMILPKIVRKGL